MSNKFIRFTHVDSTKIVSVIEVKSIRGEGTEEDPIEQITEYFSLEGERLARVKMSDAPLDKIGESL